MFGKILISALVAASVIFLLWLLRGVMLTPLRLGRGTRLTVVLTVSGAEPGLEGTIEGLVWLRENGTLPASIIIEDDGMDADTRQLAELAVKDRACVSLRGGEDAKEWKNRAETSK
ncbi:MAG: hypothetical protein RR314_05340 [Oscillospiraceae bacterium]